MAFNFAPLIGAAIGLMGSHGSDPTDLSAFERLKLQRKAKRLKKWGPVIKANIAQFLAQNAVEFDSKTVNMIHGAIQSQKITDDPVLSEQLKDDSTVYEKTYKEHMWEDIEKIPFENIGFLQNQYDETTTDQLGRALSAGKAEKARAEAGVWSSLGGVIGGLDTTKW